MRESVAVIQCQVVVNAPYTCYPTILPVCLTPAIPLCRSSGSLPGLGDSLLGSLSGPSSVTSELLVSGCSFAFRLVHPSHHFFHVPVFLPFSCVPRYLSMFPRSLCSYDRDETNLGVNTCLSANILYQNTIKLTVQVLVPLCLGLCDTISVSLLVLVVATCQSPLSVTLLYTTTHLVWFFDLAILTDLRLLLTVNHYSWTLIQWDSERNFGGVL